MSFNCIGNMSGTSAGHCPPKSSELSSRTVSVIREMKFKDLRDHANQVITQEESLVNQFDRDVPSPASSASTMSSPRHHPKIMRKTKRIGSTEVIDPKLKDKREKNRKAAEKSRRQKKEKIDRLTKENAKLVADLADAQQHIRKLTELIIQYEKRVRTH